MSNPSIIWSINTLTSAFLFVSKHIKLFQRSIEIKILLDGTIE